MTRQLQNIEEVTEVVTPAWTILDQILDLPVESVVLAQGEMPSLLHRTGPNGWLTTRGAKDGAYLNQGSVKAWYNERVLAGCTFHVIYQPGVPEIQFGNSVIRGDGTARFEAVPFATPTSL